MRLFRIAFLAVAMLLGATLPGAAQAPRSIEVTSDSAVYCQHLAARIIIQRQRLSTVDPDVDTLLERGERLCAAGRVRSGLNRLRRALHEMNETKQEELNEHGEND